MMLFMYISETFLDSSVFLDNHNISIPSSNLIWADHTDDVKRDVVCLDFKKI